MIPLIWLVGVAAIGAVALAVYWKEIVEWLKRVYEKLPDSIKQNLQGATAFVHKLGGVIKNIMNYYSYNEKTQKWTETIVSKEVNENDIPKHIREKMAKTAKVDITDELEEKLELATR
jgi:phage-related protein